MLPGNAKLCSRATESCFRGNQEQLLKESLHTGARARARARARAATTGNRSAQSNENSVLTATAELRTYKINLLGKSKRRILILGNELNRAPGQLIAGTDTSVLPGNLRSIPDMIPYEANCFLFI